MPTLQFKGKQLVQNHHLVVPFHELKPVQNKNVLANGAKASLHDNYNTNVNDPMLKEWLGKALDTYSNLDRK
jgi:hypothetical protein